MIIEHRDFPTLDNKIILWKYMSLSKFLYLLKMHSLYFCRLDCFDDMFEGKLPFLDKGLFHYTEESSVYWEKEAKRHFASCWIKSDFELNLMWSSYGKDGIAIKSTVGHLKDCMEHDRNHSVYISPVKYIDYKFDSSHNVGDNVNVYRILFTKRKFFEQEREVRLLYTDYEISDNMKGISLDVDLEKLIDCVVISPTSEPYYQSIVCEEIKALGLHIKVMKSSI